MSPSAQKTAVKLAYFLPTVRPPPLVALQYFHSRSTVLRRDFNCGQYWPWVVKFCTYTILCLNISFKVTVTWDWDWLVMLLLDRSVIGEELPAVFNIFKCSFFGEPAISHDSHHVSLVQWTNLFASRHKGHRFKSPGGYLCGTGILLLALSRYTSTFNKCWQNTSLQRKGMEIATF